MKKILIAFFLLNSLFSFSQEEKEYTENILRDVEKMTRAMEDQDWKKVVAMTYPELVKLAGGKSQMINQAQRSERELDQQGFEVAEMEWAGVSQVVEGREVYLAVIPVRMTFDGPEGKLYSESGLLGVSSDKGETWTFISIAQTDMNDIVKLFPELSKQLDLPLRRVYED